MPDRRQHFRMTWEALPKSNRWMDMLPDLSRTPFINPVLSVPRTTFFSHLSEVLYGIYAKERKAYRESLTHHDYTVTK